ncbi:MAG: hypothetical protein ACRDTQ_00895 [Micromonosporaceae bacterium]
MTAHDTYAPMTAPRTRGRATLILAALGFVLCYLSVDLVALNLASSDLPMPNAPVAKAQAWFAENQLAETVAGLCQFLSVACLGLFAIQLRKVTTSHRQAAAVRRATPWGLAAVALMMLSSGFAWLLAGLAPSASGDMVSFLRTANFIAGGAAHVLALGLFVLLASRIPGTSKPIRVLAYVAATPAVLSLVSLVWFQGAVFILLGRLLCMIWTISAAVSVTRRLAKGAWN